MGKSFEGQAQEKAGPQGQSLEGASPKEDNIEEYSRISEPRMLHLGSFAYARNKPHILTPW